MVTLNTLAAFALAYVGLLFGVAFVAERAARRGRGSTVPFFNLTA